MVEKKVDENKDLKAVAAKVVKVMAEVEKVAKGSTNKEHGYKYASIVDVVAAIRGAMVKHKLAMFPIQGDASLVEKEKGSSGSVLRLMTIPVEFLFVDAETGASQKVRIHGQGMGYDDKLAYKAATGATKYALLETFCLPTPDEAEEDKNLKDPAGKKRPEDSKGTSTGEDEKKSSGGEMKAAFVHVKAQFDRAVKLASEEYAGGLLEETSRYEKDGEVKRAGSQNLEAFKAALKAGTIPVRAAWAIGFEMKARMDKAEGATPTDEDDTSF
jgi:hypothetical protein